MKKKVAKGPHFDCEAFENNRRLLDPGYDNQGKCAPLEGRQSFFETPLEKSKVPQLSDYIEWIW